MIEATRIPGIGRAGLTQLQDYETTEAVNRESGIQYRTPNAEKLRTDNE
jgi:hypothetical protein